LFRYNTDTGQTDRQTDTWMEREKRITTLHSACYACWRDEILTSNIFANLAHAETAELAVESSKLQTLT